MDKITRQLVNAIETFAQENKVTADAIKNALPALLAHYDTDTTPKKESANKPGKPLSDQSAVVRDKIVQLGQQRKGRLFTAPELATELGTDIATVNNNLRYLVRTGGMIAAIGRAENEKGQRGRAPIIWKFK